MRDLKALAGMAMLLVLAACSGEPASPPASVAAADTLRTIAQGEIVGMRNEAGGSAWLAVPYAAPPVGELRWRAPRPPLAFPERRVAIEHGARCPQITNELSAAEGFEPGLLIGDEDCLMLDIYAPSGAGPDAGLPVMVWIHGGANVWGSSIAYDGSQLAEDRNVIVVAVQYRLGPLGFLSHPELRETAGIPQDNAANFALLDLVAALEWVGVNIDAFGGDPERVTIFGESAGAYNVAGLMAAPPARGLFHRAIMQSGGTASVPRDIAEQGGGTDANPALQAAEAFAGPDPDAAAMRAADLATIYDVYRGEDGEFSSLPRMIEDGVTLGEGGILAAASTPGGFAPVPLITGTNRDEMKLYTAFDPRLTRRLGPLLWIRDRDRYEAAVEYPSRNWRVNAVDDLLDRLVASGHRDVWAYRFDWDEGGQILVSDTSALLGASHGMEIPFVFNRFKLFGSFDKILFTAGNADGRNALADAMGAYWAQFAQAGDPGSGGGAGPVWPRWDGTARFLRFDTPEGGGLEIASGRDAPAAIAADLAADDRIDAEGRCAIAGNMQVRQPELAAAFASQIEC